MDIQILHLLEGAKAARGLTVVIDVFRAFSLECYFHANGAKAVYPIGSEALARELKQRHPDWMLAGERKGFKLPGFDFGNSPAQAEGAELSGRTVVHTTSAGTQGIANASGADELLTGSLVNAGAIARYIRMRQPETVSLVCMGVGTVRLADEDELCARYIRDLLLGETPDIREEADALRFTTGARFFNPEHQADLPSRDFELCTQVSVFDFVLRLEPDADGLLRTVRIDV